MGWKKSGIPMLPSVYGRVLLHTTFTKKENWLTVLIIRNLKESDSGDYTFTVKVGPAVMSVTRSILVLPKQGQLFFFSFFQLLPSKAEEQKTCQCPYQHTKVLSNRVIRRAHDFFTLEWLGSRSLLTF